MLPVRTTVANVTLSQWRLRMTVSDLGSMLIESPSFFYMVHKIRL